MVLDLPGFYYDEATNRYFRLPRPAALAPSPSPLAAAGGVHAVGGGGRGGGRGGEGGGVGRGGSGDGGRGGGGGRGGERYGGERDRHGKAHPSSATVSEKVPTVFQLLREREAGGRRWHPSVVSYDSSPVHGAHSLRAECTLESQPASERRRRRKRGKEHAEKQQQDGSHHTSMEYGLVQRRSHGDAVGGNVSYSSAHNERATNGRAGADLVGDSGRGGHGARLKAVSFESTQKSCDSGRGGHGDCLKAVSSVFGRAFETAARTAGMRNLKMWQYQVTERACDAGMAVMHVVAQGDEGAHVRTGLLVGHRLGDVSLLELTDQEETPSTTRPTTLQHHWPVLLSSGSSISTSGQRVATYDLPRPPPPPAFSSLHSLFLGSDVTSIRTLPWGSRAIGDSGVAAGSCAAITTLGTGGHPARVLLAALDLADSSGGGPTRGGTSGANGAAAGAGVASAAGAGVSRGGGSGRRGSSRQRLLHWQVERQFELPGSVWACECSPKQGEIGVGTSLGLRLLHVETGQRTALCHSNSDVLALQVTGEGSTYLAGFRNGAIATIDMRAPLPTSAKQLPPPPLRHPADWRGLGGGRRGKRGAAGEVNEYYCSHQRVMRMPSAVSGMQAMKQSDFYLFASSFDGSLFQWDLRSSATPLRQLQGHRNSHFHLPLLLDPSENFICAPGNDYEARIWSVSTGALLSAAHLPGHATAALWSCTSGESRLAKVPIERIRNFSIIAHIDHGKSTLADKLLETTGTVQAREMKEQFLDNMELERERGITIKLQAARMRHVSRVDGKAYCLNLIDTPGHVDFSYEVSRSLAACEGALLVVDASQGVEAQTLANVYLAIEGNLEIIPVLNKIDLPGADPERVRAEVEEVVGLDASDAILCSAKEGVGIQDILESIIAKVPPPAPTRDQPLRCLIFDSYYDPYRGVIVYFRVVDGEVRKGDSVRFMASGKQYEVDELGVLSPTQMPVDCLYAGEVGYLAASIRQVADARVGDTITHAGGAGKGGPPAKEGLPGYREAVPMVFCGLFPIDADQFPSLREALEKLQLNDAALQFEPESSSAMGFGFRCGFLGLLHMDVVQERLEREYSLDLITTAPSVVYRVVKRDGSVVECSNPADMPDASVRTEIQEPYVRLDILTPKEYIGTLMDLAQERRGEFVEMKYVTESRTTLSYDTPLGEVVGDFFDQLKSRTKGYASMEYKVIGYRKSNLVKMDIQLNGEIVEPLSAIVHQEKVRSVFKIPIQASMHDGVLVAGGDISRKKKLLKKQAAGKKRMKALGRVEVPQDAFMAVLRLEKESL
ncbi:unnamed protein product [Closterium sp. NIES-65]|nr:unnamed protein product [Closterium sp. NIES-65]